MCVFDKVTGMKRRIDNYGQTDLVLKTPLQIAEVATLNYENTTISGSTQNRPFLRQNDWIRGVPIAREQTKNEQSEIRRAKSAKMRNEHATDDREVIEWTNGGMQVTFQNEGGA